MNFREYFDTICGSDPEDWVDARSQPYLSQAGQVEGGGQPVPWIELDQPHTLLTYRPDLTISVAVGRKHLEDFQEDWVRNFPDQRASSSWVDFLYGGHLIYSEIEVLVDGARCGLPVPNFEDNAVPQSKHDLFRTLDALTGIGEYDRYFRAAGFEISQQRWPR